MKKLILTLFVCVFTAGYVNSQTDKYDKVGSYGSKGVSWALVQKENKYGFIDRSGKEVVPVNYDNIASFGSKGISWSLVRKGNKYGYIDSYGNVVIPVKYDNPNNIPLKKYKKQYKSGLLKDNPPD